MVQWIVDCDFVPIFTGDGNLLLRDDLIGGDGVLCPIPERLAQITGGLLPVFCIDCVCRSDLLGMLLQNLLINNFFHQFTRTGKRKKGYMTKPRKA